MVQVHTVYEASTWRLTVDGLRQECPTRSRSGVEAWGRRIAADLRGRLVVHDVDGRVLDTKDYGTAEQERVEPEMYLG